MAWLELPFANVTYHQPWALVLRDLDGKSSRRNIMSDIDRDAQGLTPRKMDDEAAAAKAAKMYWPMLFGQVPAIQLVLALGTYLILYYVIGYKETLDAKFAFLHAYDLGYALLAVYFIGLGRWRIMLNANVTRAAARVDRPDQHVYKVMDPKTPADAPYVLMANTGRQGEFNRAQRGVFNTDEAMPMFLVSTVLAGAVFGPVILGVVGIAVYGRIQFALLYTADQNKRGAGFMPAMIGEQWAVGLVLFAAIKAIGGERVPF